MKLLTSINSTNTTSFLTHCNDCDLPESCGAVQIPGVSLQGFCPENRFYTPRRHRQVTIKLANTLPTSWPPLVPLIWHCVLGWASVLHKSMSEISVSHAMLEFKQRESLQISALVCLVLGLADCSLALTWNVVYVGDEIVSTRCNW